MLNGHQYPWLAESWEYNEDATELTYYLRDGVTWSDGDAFHRRGCSLHPQYGA